MNLQDLQAELAKLERRRQTLEKRIKARSARQFAALPAKVGLKSIDELILELLPYGSNGLRSRLGAKTNGAGVAPAKRGKRPGRPAGGTPAGTRGKRYGEDVKAAVKAALEEGTKTIAEISRELGPTVFSINGWKKKWGLTRARKKK